MSKSFLLKNIVNRSQAERAYEKLSGLFCVYKPPDMDLLELMRKIRFVCLKGLNELPCRPVEQLVKFDDSNNRVYLEASKSDTIEGTAYQS